MAEQPATDGCMRRTAATTPPEEKTASISIFLLEELGDARVRCSQLKKYIEEATTLIEKSDKRDHIFEVAGHLIHGIPEVVFKMEKALEAAAMAANRIDYEEVKERLKPEKVTELENALEDVRIRQLKRRSDDQQESPPMNAKEAAETTKEEWQKALKEDERLLVKMQHDLEKLKRGEKVENLTIEGAQHSIKGLEAVIHNKKQLISKLASDTNRETQTAMNAKTAAEELNSIADQVDTTGQVPVDRVLTLTAALEKGLRTASKTGAEPKKVSAFFRGLASELVKPSDKPASRYLLAQKLRAVIADQMPMAQMPQTAQVAAIYQQANSREEVMKGFKDANPSMSDADLEKAADMWEKHKNVVKEKHQ